MEIYPGALPDGMVPMDIDVTPMDNSKTSKLGGSRTYKGFDGCTNDGKPYNKPCQAAYYGLRKIQKY